MQIRFRPYVQFIEQGLEILHILVDQKPLFLPLSSQLQWDYDKLYAGVDSKNVPEPVSKFLDENQLCEHSDDEIFFVEPALAFLRNYATTQNGLREYAQQIKNTRFKIIQLSKFDAYDFSGLRRHCSAEVIADCTKSSSQDFVIVIVSDYKNIELETLNKHFLANGISWLLVNDNFDGLTVGPFFANPPSDTCYNCFLLRFTSHKENGYRLTAKPEVVPDHRHFGMDVQYHWLEFELLKTAALGGGKYTRRLYSFDSVNNHTEAFPYMPYPLCRVCKS